MKIHWSLECLIVIAALISMVFVGIDLSKESAKCDAYGKAHGIPTTYYALDGCISVTVTKRLY